MPNATDQFGLTVTGATREAVQAFDLFGREWIGYGPKVGAIFSAASQCPNSPLLQACSALLHMALEAQSGHDAALSFLAAARSGAAASTLHEQAIIKAAMDWHAGDLQAALDGFERAVGLAPQDIVAAKWGQYLAFNMGDAPAMLRLAERILTAHRHTPEAWGMLAFGQEQTHDLQQAETSARHALALNPDEAWAQHALAHVFETTGRLDEGVELLKNASPGWKDRSIFMREHNFWHLALFHLDRDEPSQAVALFDRHLWGEWPEFAQEQIGAISLLWRLELRGADVGGRWQDVSGKVVDRGFEHLWPFHDLHFVYALARGGHNATTEAFLASLRRKAGERAGIWNSVAWPAALAIVACARGQYESAADGLAPLLRQLHHIGGSHAQRDIFVQAWLHAAMQSGQATAVEHVLAQRQSARPGVAVHRRELDLCRRAL